MPKHNGLWRACFLVVALLGDGSTSAAVLKFLRDDNVSVSAHQVQIALAGLCRAKDPLIERETRLRSVRYRLTERGRAVYAED